MTAEEVAELSGLLDEALAVESAERDKWLGALEHSRPRMAQRLREMLRRLESQDPATLLPDLPQLDRDDAVAASGDRVGPYRLLHEIGRGGMGSVWLAERADDTFKRRVALKLPRLVWATGLAQRMTRERDIGALLEHPNIARLYDAGVDEHGRPYIAMQYIDGQPIDQYCRGHSLDLRGRLELFLKVAQAVAYAHRQLVLHRDLKPANVLVDDGRHVHLLDFGIAKLIDEAGGSELTREQGRVLTLNYAAPEQIAGQPLGVTADVYGLGVMLYELLTGALPYTVKRNTTGAMEEAILAGDAPWASRQVADRRLARELRGDLDAILAKAIKREPKERYATAEALAADIQRYLDGHAIEARPDSAWYRLRKAIERHRVPVTAAAVVLVVAIVGATATFLQGRRAAAEAQRTQLATAFVIELFRVNASQAPSANDSQDQVSPSVFVDRGAQLIEARFERQPDMKAEMYGAVGRVYADLGVDRLASEYAMRQLETLREQNASAPRIARALMLLAEAALAAQRDGDAVLYAQQAASLLPDGAALLPDAMALLARAQIRTGKLAEAWRSLDSGRRMLAARGIAKSVAGAWLMFEESALMTRENNVDEAWPLGEAAIAEAIEAAGPHSSAAIEMRLRSARFACAILNLEKCRQQGDAAVLALQELGEVGKIRAALARANLQHILSRSRGASYAETMSVLDDASVYLRSRAPFIPPETLAEVEFYAAVTHCYWGEPRLSKPLLDTHAAILLQSRQTLAGQIDVLFGLGGCALGIGDHDAADRYIRQAIELQIKGGFGTIAGPVAARLPWMAGAWLMAAGNLSMKGLYREAEELLLNTTALDDRWQGDPEAWAEAIAIGIARVRLDAGDFRGAQQALPSGWRPPKHELSLGVGAFRVGDQQLYGEVMCATGHQQVGLEYLRLVQKFVTAFGSPNSPVLARSRAVAGLCALSIGARKEAEEMALLAQLAFEANPEVSPYFKKPLAELERRLGAGHPTRTGFNRPIRSRRNTQNAAG